MSKFIFLRLRNGTRQLAGNFSKRVELGARRLAPQGAGVRDPVIKINDSSIAAILNPTTTVLSRPGAIGVGHIVDFQWDRIHGGSPEGTYAICRFDSSRVEILSDAVASRTIWYYIDEEIFIASTSQRWITILLGDFQFNLNTTTWLLTSGTLGPVDGWDLRVQRLQADSTLLLNTMEWRMQIETREPHFETEPRLVTRWRNRFARNLQESFERLDFDYSSWVLPLSGGYDSRAILSLLRNTQGLKAVTWGTRSSANDSRSDAAIAIRLAHLKGLNHEYFQTDYVDGALRQVFERFLQYGEGRIDSLSGYLDGFRIWQTLIERQVCGIIRGDEAFGWRPVSTFEQSRRSVGLLLWTDYDNLPDRESLGLPPQPLPAFLGRRSKETIDQWRDRLYQQFRCPTILAALNDLKSPFVEIANPLLNHSIINFVRTMPDHLRTDKKALKNYMHDIGPRLPYALARSILSQQQILSSPEAATILRETLCTDTSSFLLPKTFLSWLQTGLAESDSFVDREAPSSRLRRAPNFFRAIRPARSNRHNVRSMNCNVMAFRAYLLCKMYDLLHADVDAAKEVTNEAAGQGYV